MNRKTTVGILSLCLLLGVVSVLSPWGQMSKNAGPVTGATISLWKICGKETMNGVSKSTCANIPSSGNPNFPKHALYACRVLSILGLSLILLNLVSVSHKKIFNKVNISLRKTKIPVSLLLLGLGSLCLLSSVMVWHYHLMSYSDAMGNKLNWDHDAGFNIMCVVAGISLVMSVLLMKN